MRRIPDGWGRWISCDAGWYPLIVDLDAAMAAIWPTYVVQQVKEKFGSLRFYFDAEGLPLEDPRHRRRDALLRDAEERSLRTCEVCGADAVLCKRRGWLKTLCAGCRRLEHNRGFVPVAG